MREQATVYTHVHTIAILYLLDSIKAMLQATVSIRNEIQ